MRLSHRYRGSMQNFNRWNIRLIQFCHVFSHNFLNPETFVDYRRYDFSDQVFIGLKMREEADSSGEYAGEWFRRASYPSTEVTRNRVAVEANKQTPVTPVWWDAQN